jgi:RNA polymerase sporulation-specific sigma factor
MARNKVEISGLNTSKIITIKSKEMNELFVRYQNGDKSAKDELVNCNLRLVLSILKRFQNRTDNMDDLFQIGVVGLIKAIDNFDLKHNVKFSTYAVPMILGEIKRYIRDNNSLRVSRGIRETAYKIINYRDKYFAEFGHEPSTGDIAHFLGISEYDVGAATLSLKEPMSIFEPIYNDGGDTIYLLDQIEDVKEKREIDDIISLRKALNNINPREKKILVSRYILGRTQTEIAKDLKISQAQVSRLEKNATRSLKRFIK